ncbi:MAG: ankyrin repeat domain-containing protein [Gammaproteobacteria bacterium]|nr:ankyrin repeat domain-containing protein [Gammaproteobacteria bacterium]MBP9729494.1 ankyrin repeat domain-containing protein [Gammaproteobacteria bacterium]
MKDLPPPHILLFTLKCMAKNAEADALYAQAIAYSLNIALDPSLAASLEEQAKAWQTIAHAYHMQRQSSKALYYYRKAQTIRRTLYPQKLCSPQEAIQLLYKALTTEMTVIEQLAHIEQALDTGLYINANYNQYADNPNDPDDPKCFSPLALAAAEGHEAACKLLLLRGARTQQKLQIHIPLVEAVANGDIQIAKLLLEHNADIDVCDGTRNTALSIAISEGFYHLAELLLLHHPRLDLRNEDRETVLEIAMLDQNLALSTLLLSYGAPLPEDLSTDNPSFLKLLQKYQHFDQQIHARTTVPALIDFIRKEHSKGHLLVVQRTLALKFGAWGYPRHLFERFEDVQPFYDHLQYFGAWLQANPGIVAKDRVEDTQILAFFGQYLAELAQKAPLSKLRMDIRDDLTQHWQQPLEITNYIWGLSNVGIAIPFHSDLVKKQAALSKQLEESFPGFNKELLQKPRGRTLLWSQSPFAQRAIQANTVEPRTTRTHPSSKR